jgi:hypothetical protein
LHLCLSQPELWFSYSYFWYSWDDRHMLACSSDDWDGVLLTFCPDWLWISILPIYLQVAGLTIPFLFFLFFFLVS